MEVEEIVLLKEMRDASIVPPYSRMCWEEKLLRERQVNLPSTPEVSRARCARIPSSLLFFEATIKYRASQFRKHPCCTDQAASPRTLRCPAPVGKRHLWTRASTFGPLDPNRQVCFPSCLVDITWRLCTFDSDSSPRIFL